MSCTGKPCTEVKYEFVSFNPPLAYVYTPAGGAPQTGTLDPANHQDYAQMWLVSFLTWMGFGLWPGFSPFRNTKPDCDKGCECDLGPEVVTIKEYTYTPPEFTLNHGSKIKISGKFTMRIKTRSGVCTPAAGREFSLAPAEMEEMFALMPVFDTDIAPPVDAG